MRYRLAQIVFVAVWLLVGGLRINAQSTDSTSSCPDSPASEKNPSGPEISITEVTFSGSLQMPVADQEQIADSVKQTTKRTSLDDVTDEGLERARTGWQDRGYFKVEVAGEARTLTSSPVSQSVALNIQVEEGSRYTLSGISFKHNQAISNRDTLRRLFPIQDGDIFSREKFGRGLVNLRRAYGELGYVNFTSVPDTQFDDENQLISLVIDLDEGKQFRVARVNVLGLEESARDKLLESLPIKPGQIYSSSLWEESLLTHASMFPGCDCPNREQLREDDKSGRVILTFDFRPCPTR